MNGETETLYRLARRVLLDALQALGPQHEALVLVGAQAVYLHTGDANLVVAPYTKDADVALDPALLQDEPLLADVLGKAGFRPGEHPGSWHGQSDIPVDLLVPATLGGPGRRGARLGVHGNRAARKVAGLEGALVDREKRARACSDWDQGPNNGIKNGYFSVYLLAGPLHQENPMGHSLAGPIVELVFFGAALIMYGLTFAFRRPGAKLFASWQTVSKTYTTPGIFCYWGATVCLFIGIFIQLANRL